MFSRKWLVPQDADCRCTFSAKSGLPQWEHLQSSLTKHCLFTYCFSIQWCVSSLLKTMLIPCILAYKVQETKQFCIHGCDTQETHILLGSICVSVCLCHFWTIIKSLWINTSAWCKLVNWWHYYSFWIVIVFSPDPHVS